MMCPPRTIAQPQLWGNDNSEYKPRRCWYNSRVGPVKFQPMIKSEVAKLWHSALRWDRSTRSTRKHGGIIGRTALHVLHTLLWEFLNFRTGRLDPSLDGIAEKASMSRSAVIDALAKLRELGLIGWLRRRETRYNDRKQPELHQLTNAYAVANTTNWRGFIPRDPPPPDRDQLGFPEPMDTSLAAASKQLATGDKQTVYRTLTSDQQDRLAVALAELGRSMGAI